MSEEPQPHDVGDLAAPDFEADTVPATDNNAHGVVISLLAKALGLLAAAGRFVAQFFAWIRRWWTRRWRVSLQFRTVATTLIIASVAVVGVGGYLAGQISNGLFQERLTQAQQESARGATQVQESFSNASLSDQPRVSTYVGDTLRLLEVGGADDNRKYLMVKIPGQTSRLAVSSSDSGGVTTAIIPDELREAVQSDPDGQFWQSIALPTGESGFSPAVVVGSQVELLRTHYELYMIYDLNTAQMTLNYIQSVLWLAGGILLLLIGVIIWYVTRTVVKPVSEAAAVSEKLAAGELEERMAVSGEDEMARLATSFNKMATSLQDQITALGALSEMQQRFVSDVSHELRTPLTTVRMAAEVLFDAREDFDPINKRSSELLFHQVERFELLLADLLEISRFDAGVADLDVESLDIFSVIHSVIDGAMPVAEANKAELSVVTRLRSHKCVVEMDSRRIDRILRNLVLNAVEHSEGNPVKIYVSADESAVAVAVRDYGIGMSPAALGHVFDRFWRADSARARTTGGSGLGLSIAMEDARLHDGWLDAWGVIGEGSCFRLTLPRKRGTVLTHSPVPLPPDGGQAGSSSTLNTSPVLTHTGALGVVGALGSIKSVPEAAKNQEKRGPDPEDPGITSSEKVNR
ncbi:MULTISPECIES: MtrAB system histidine kinase MtrB [Arthrobacter]|uniref:Sensor histidine kinase MtrB n=1 Tax=Arthrobacter psychrochitiniphilus TaxID=291045 RepID=A0A2V3DQL1_9MICC|nr:MULTISPECIES: MtrAB system histidine kinase MtrB [Arthrobacter]NYG18363.1 two-component system sensor histidine kinase MtrB [Arthrobacter psychrochitiniphilus]PXA64586.1 two-component sensor histidine kinase [Arthrobacter psychrochitiniphilus]